jgi:hypothetical protein
MTRDEIYNHLAQVYLGKRNKEEEKHRKQYSAWLVINIVITVVIFASAFYGFTAFLTNKRETIEKSVIYALNNGPIRVKYDLQTPYPPVKTFSLTIPEIDLSKYGRLNFSIRGLDEGAPGIVKVVIQNERLEKSAYYINKVGTNWQDYSIPIDKFIEITDWTNLTSVSFVFEAWNVDKKRGAVLIDDVRFSG